MFKASFLQHRLAWAFPLSLPSSWRLPLLLPPDPSPYSLYPHWKLDLTHKDMTFVLFALPSGCLPGTLIQSMVKNLEKQLEVPVKKPAGGVNLFLTPNAGPQRAAAPGKKPQLSDDDSDLEVSSLEDLPQDLDQKEKPRPLSRLKLPETFGTSAWSPGQPRVPGW